MASTGAKTGPRIRPHRRHRTGATVMLAALVAVVVLFAGVGVPAAAPGADGLHDARSVGACSCPLCADTAPDTTALSGGRLQAAAAALAAGNRRELDRIDALLRSGRLGPPQSRTARQRAQLMVRLTLDNWYSFLLPLVSDPERVWAVTPEDLAPVAARYCEATVVPLPRLRELRLGRGRVCARYDLGGPLEEGSTVLGGRRLNHRLREMAVPGGRRRVLALDWQSAGSGRIELLVGEHYGFRLERRVLADGGEARVDLYLALDVTGGWVRRFGVHRPEAFAFWATRPTADLPYLPAAPQVGSAIYLPGLTLRLPLVPDIDLDDVRILALPMPFLEAEDLRRGELPSWLPSEGALRLDSWTSLGPPPSVLRTYFQDRRGDERDVVGMEARAACDVGARLSR